MPFTVLPAIDLWEGRLALLTGDGPAPSDAFGGDPLAAAAAYVGAGARWLHVVDMDLAFRGEAGNADLIRGLCAAGGARVQASGGVRTAAQVEELRSLGAARVVLASAALAHYAWNRGLYEDWQESYDAYHPVPRPARRSTANALAESVDRASRVTVALAIGAGVTLGAGTVLFFSSSTTSGARAASDERWIGVRGSF